MSFLLDPPLLVASGAVIERAVADPARRDQAERATAGLFVAVSLALYANVPGLSPLWRRFGARSGRDFMLGSGLAATDDRALGRGRHLAALSLFALYPAWVRLGRRAARGGPR